MVDVIEIDDSDDETAIIPKGENQVNGDHHPNVVAIESQDDKPQVIQVENNIKNESQQSSNNNLLESRREKIDQLLDVYIKYHHRLISVEYMMTPEQKNRWQTHLSTSYTPASSVPTRQTRRTTATQNAEQIQAPPVYDQHYQPGPSTSSGFGRPTWFIDSPPEVGSSSRATYRRSAAPRARRAPRRKRRYTSTAASRGRAKKPKRTTTTRTDSVVSRKPRSTTTTTSATTRPKASTSKTSVDKKPKVTKLQAMLAKVKKER